MTANSTLVDMLSHMSAQLARIEEKVGRLSAPEVLERDNPADVAMLNIFTTKQHAILQMLLRDAPNSEIAERLDVTTSTVKTHIAMICRKLGVKRRASAITTAAPMFGRVSDDVYETVSGGLPKNWDATYDPDNPINERVRLHHPSPQK